MEGQKTQASQHNIKGEEQVGGWTLHNFKTCYKAIVIENVVLEK